jgi:NTE family protein
MRAQTSQSRQLLTRSSPLFFREICDVRYGHKVIVRYDISKKANQSGIMSAQISPIGVAEKSIHIVLGAGGNRCIAYVGALRALSEIGYKFASISACSAGTVIAALLCAGISPTKLEQMILATNLERFQQKPNWFSTLRIFFRWPYSIYSSSHAAEIVREFLSSDPNTNPDPRLGDLSIPFATIGVDLVSNSFVIYSSDSETEMRVSEAISIATAIPFMFPPYQKGGRIVVDAAVATQCPIWLSSLQKSTSPILALTCLSERSVETPRNFGDYLGRIISAGAASGDEAMLSIMPRLHRIEIACPKVEVTDFAISNETKRALLDAGKKAILKVDLNGPGPAFASETLAERTNSAKSVINHYYKEVIMNNNVNVGGNAIVNIDSTLNNVQQTMGQVAGLSAEKKSDFEKLIAEMQVEIVKIKESHSQEAALIAQRLQEVVQGAAHPPEKRNSTLLSLSGKGLVEAAETVGKIAPKLLLTASLVAKFIAGI